MPDRVDDELRRVSTALAEVSPPKPDLSVREPSPRRPRVLVGVASFVVVLGIGLIAGLVLGGDPAQQPTVATTVAPASTLPVAPTASVPEDHLAAELLAEESSYEEFAAVSVSCSSGGSLAGPHTLCLVDDQGLMVVVPLRIAAGVDAVVSGTAFDGETTISLPAVRSESSLPDIDDLTAIGHGEGSFEVELHYNGEPARASVSGYFPSDTEQAASGTVPIPDGHIAHDVIAREAGIHEIPDLGRELGFEYHCLGGGAFYGCFIWEDGVAVIIPTEVRSGASLRVRSPSHDNEWLDIQVEAGVPVGVRHETGLFAVQKLRDGDLTSNSHSYFPSSSSP